MPRSARSWYEGAMYHIMCRGNHRHWIFGEDIDYSIYTRILWETHREFPFLIHAYCLMGNHVHLMIETTDVPIGRIMQKINMKYASFFNRKYHFVGHLFQDRFASETITTRSYFLELSRYIHRNPLEAGLCDNLADYPWSSYPVYMKQTESTIITTDEILSCFIPPTRFYYRRFVEADGQERYREYIEPPSNRSRRWK